ncbi:ganglioside GM2 activator-like [Mercenaria mercenaria]|uniref:ganglioside GM2 activator-like n=1 Tax=Mercenaria mercenaria TaxID=6596 RepID=UPI00234F93EA|nr:ganglioside GM2 activator-like [Mercenaria mercenaria]
MFFKIQIFIVALSFTSPSALQFRDCATDNSTAAFTVHQMVIFPPPLLFPGELRAAISITINRQISNLWLDFVKEKNILGMWNKLPCIENTWGSCTNIDYCAVLDKFRNSQSVNSGDFEYLIEEIIFTTLGYDAHCPIDPKTIYENHIKIRLQGIQGSISQFMTGRFRIRISLKDDPTSPDNIGCVQFEVEIGNNYSGVSVVG